MRALLVLIPRAKLGKMGVRLTDPRRGDACGVRNDCDTDVIRRTTTSRDSGSGVRSLRSSIVQSDINEVLF